MLTDKNVFHSNKCRMTHDVNSTHNTTLLKKAGLQDLKEKELFQLLLQNDPTLLPEVECVTHHFEFLTFRKY